MSRPLTQGGLGARGSEAPPAPSSAQTGRPRLLHGPWALGRPSSPVTGCGFLRSYTGDLPCLKPPGAGLSELRSRPVQFHGVRPAFVKEEEQSPVRCARSR